MSVSGLCCRDWGKGQEILLKWPAITRRSLVLGALVETQIWSEKTGIEGA